MPVHDPPRGSRRRRYRPSLEGLEGRDLPSAATALIAAAGPAAVARSPRAPATGGQQIPTPAWVNESLLQGLARSLYAPITTTDPIQVGSQVFPPGTYAVPQPTPAEIRRQTFWAEFTGTYYVGPPRFSDQASTIHIYSNGKGVTSNQLFHGRAQIVLFPPADPTAQPTTLDPVAGQVTGLAFINASNVLQSGSLLFTEVTNLPGVASNAPTALDHGLPSHLEFLIDPGGVNGGIYSTPAYYTLPPQATDLTTGTAAPLTGGSGGAVAFNQGAGYLDITYVPDAHPRAGTVESGKVIVRMQGLLNLAGVFNPLFKGIN
jgi:hypothetical protein